jgi:hypothetical protein
VGGNADLGISINYAANNDYATPAAAQQLANCLGDSWQNVAQSPSTATFYIPPIPEITLSNGVQQNAAYIITRYFVDNAETSPNTWSYEMYCASLTGGSGCGATNGSFIGTGAPEFYTAVGLSVPNFSVSANSGSGSQTTAGQTSAASATNSADYSSYSWYSAWTTSGHNGDPSVLTFIANQPNQPAGVNPFTLAASLGKSIPYDGGDSAIGIPGPWLAVANPDGSQADLRLYSPTIYGAPPQFSGSWFIHPGDDVMAVAIKKWISPPTPTAAGATSGVATSSVVAGNVSTNTTVGNSSGVSIPQSSASAALNSAMADLTACLSAGNCTAEQIAAAQQAAGTAAQQQISANVQNSLSKIKSSVGNLVNQFQNYEQSLGYNTSSGSGSSAVTSTSGSANPPPSNISFPATISVTASSLNVRSQPDTAAPLSGSQTLSSGDTFTATSQVTGESIDGNDIWYVSSLGNYVWSGGTEVATSAANS